MAQVLSDAHKAHLRDLVDEYTAGDNRKIPGVVYCAFGRDGQPIFQHCSGTTGISTRKPMTHDTIFWLASFTKILTSLSCMQLVEQGKLGLDNAAQLEEICPELRDVKVLTRDSEGQFQLVEKKRSITLRMLLNHTAGFGYAFEDERLAEYGRPVGLDDFSGERIEFINRPLVNQPGETFQYGTSMDWVGVIIERLTGQTLEDYFQQNILQPLGMDGISFYPSSEAIKNLAYMHRRSKTGELTQTDHLYRQPLVASMAGQLDQIYCAGGHGCFGKPSEFRKLIGLLLNGGTDVATGVQLLKPQTVDEMFKDQIPDKPRYSNVCVPVAKTWLANATPLEPMPDDHTEGWGLSWSISHQPTETGRSAGTASWEGLANLYWFADRENGLGGIIATQILPYGDRIVLECQDRVEIEIYNAMRACKP